MLMQMNNGMNFIFNDLAVIVTGGSKGYGAGIAAVMRRRGADVWITGRERAAVTTACNTYDLAVIGGGSGGVAAALAAARAGLHVVIVERGDMLGGTSTLGGLAHACGAGTISQQKRRTIASHHQTN